MTGPFSGSFIPGTGSLFENIATNNAIVPLFQDVRSYSLQEVVSTSVSAAAVEAFLRSQLVQNGDGKNFIELNEKSSLFINFKGLEISNEHFFEGLRNLLKDKMFSELDAIALCSGKFHPNVWLTFIDLLKNYPNPPLLEFLCFIIPLEAFELLQNCAKDISVRGYTFQENGFSDQAQGIACLSKLFESSKSTLEYVRMTNIGLDDTSVKSIRVLKGAPKLQYLGLAYNRLTDRSVPFLVKVICSCPKLVMLDFEDNKFTDVGARGLTVAMGDAEKSEMEVDLSGHKGITDRTAALFFKLAPQVTKVALNDCGLVSTEILNGVIEAEFYKKGKRKQIEEVSIKGNPIVSSSLEATFIKMNLPKKIRVQISKFPEIGKVVDVSLFQVDVGEGEVVQIEPEFEKKLGEQLRSTDIAARREGLQVLIKSSQNTNNSEKNKLSEDMQDLFYEILLKREFSFKEIARDGNCFFNAVFDGLEAVFESDLKKTFIDKLQSEKYKVLFRDHVHNHALRLAVVQYMEDNRNDFEPFFDDSEVIEDYGVVDQKVLDMKPFDRHCSIMRVNKKWAGDHERKAVQDFLNSIGMNVSLVIYDLRKRPVIGDDGKLSMPEELSGVKPDSKIIYLYHSINHYTLMFPKTN